MEKLYTVSKKTRPGTDCGSDISSYCKIQPQLEESRENH